MKILPDYLIQYMPELEEALEELRLSVIDHAYELLKCLDIDELSSDDIRRKLELYSLKLENMTSDWLPNGRFYRMYPSIKHHRTRHNAITSIVKSGGQFEGVWSSDFTKKQQYNYKLIQLLRHYQMQSPMDGYFYISGDATRNTNGSISGSTLTALSTDALLTQALPAGYTYLYVPWPRPHYPTDSDYFYNVHMLQFDLFHYAEDCDKPYGYNGNVYDLHMPASLSYYNAATAKQPPYWFDYHYIGDDKHPNLVTINGDSTYRCQWPIVESGIYKDKDNHEIAKIVVRKNKETGKSSSQMFKPYDGDTRTWIPATDAEIEYLNKEAVEYVLDKSCASIADSSASWITNCYLHTKYRFSEPNRSQVFTPIERSVVFGNSSISDKELFKQYIIETFKLSEEKADSIINTGDGYISISLNIEDCTAEYLSRLINDLDSHSLGSSEDLKFSYEIVENSIDENCLIEPNLTFSPKASAYKFDRLTAGLLYHFTESWHHVKTYRPVWDVSSPIFAMSQSDYTSSNDNDSEDPASWGHSSHSLLSWFTAKQDNNIPALNKDSYYCEPFIRDNGYVCGTAPTASQETFTSFDRPTTSNLDLIYLALFYPAQSNSAFNDNEDDTSSSNENDLTTEHQQGDLYRLSDTVAENPLYAYNESESIIYDVTLAYTVMGFNSDRGLVEEDFGQYMIGHPASTVLNNSDSSLFVRKNSSENIDYSYVTYKTSLVHKLWFSADKSSKTLVGGTARDDSLLYNSCGSFIHYHYTGLDDNLVTLSYNVLGVYREDGTKIVNAPVMLRCIIDNTESRYTLYYSASAEVKDACYVLFTVSVINEPMDVITEERITTSLWMNHTVRSRQIVRYKDTPCLSVEYRDDNHI